jgi:SAM-dependent methyltransferase
MPIETPSSLRKFSARNDDLRLDMGSLIVNDYDPIASVFDEVMGCDFLAAIGDFRITKLVDLLSKKSHYRVLDLCCGTGLFLCRIASLVKIDGIGIDLSKRQLEVASARVRDEAAPVRLVRADILRTEFPSCCDLVTINFDSLNHLRKLEDWEAIFKKAFEALAPGGTLAFDVNTPERLTRDWDYPEVIVKEDLTYIHIGLEVKHFGGCVTRRTPMIIFKRHGALFERIQALVEHMAVPNATIERILKESGFSRVSWYFPSKEQTKRHIFLKQRAFFVAEK